MVPFIPVALRFVARSLPGVAGQRATCSV